MMLLLFFSPRMSVVSRFQLMLKCFAFEPDNRPEFLEVHKALKSTYGCVHWRPL